MFNLFNAAKKIKDIAYGNDSTRKEVLNALVEDRFTPDAHTLYTRQWWNVFVYNECMEGQRANHILGPNSEKRAAAFTKDSDFVLMRKMLGNETFPFAIKIEEENRFGNSSFYGQPARILGHLFKMPPSAVKALDTHVLNTVQFNRVRVTLDVPYRKMNIKSVEDKITKELGELQVAHVDAFMYVAQMEFWADVIKHFGYKPAKLLTANNGKEDLELQYYYFNERFKDSSG